MACAAGKDGLTIASLLFVAIVDSTEFSTPFLVDLFDLAGVFLFVFVGLALVLVGVCLDFDLACLLLVLCAAVVR